VADERRHPAGRALQPRRGVDERPVVDVRIRDEDVVLVSRDERHVRTIRTNPGAPCLSNPPPRAGEGRVGARLTCVMAGRRSTVFRLPTVFTDSLLRGFGALRGRTRAARDSWLSSLADYRSCLVLSKRIRPKLVMLAARRGSDRTQFGLDLVG